MSTAFYRWLLLRVIPYIRFTTYYTSLRGFKYHAGYDLLKPGDIIVCVDKKKLTSFLIPGEFSHAALCVSKNKKWEISEMTHHDYTKSCFFDVCKESDRVVILRCRDWDRKYIRAVIANCKILSVAKYDLEFSLGVEALYCSELVYQSDIQRRLKVDLSDLEGLGRQYISPDGLYHAENVDVVWDSDEVENEN